jgi:hypothetical protein
MSRTKNGAWETIQRGVGDTYDKVGAHTITHDLDGRVIRGIRPANVVLTKVR